MRSKMVASSFMSAMLRSRCVFSMTLAASATLMLGAWWMPACTTAPYAAATRARDSGVSPETTLVMLSRRCSRSPGLMRSGEYPRLKSTPASRPEPASRMGPQTSSVAPG